MGRRRKLTDEDVLEIIECRKLFHACSSPALAKKYGVSRSLIHKISIHGVKWREHEKRVACRSAMAAPITNVANEETL